LKGIGAKKRIASDPLTAFDALEEKAVSADSTWAGIRLLTDLCMALRDEPQKRGNRAEQVGHDSAIDWNDVALARQAGEFSESGLDVVHE